MAEGCQQMGQGGGLVAGWDQDGRGSALLRCAGWKQRQAQGQDPAQQPAHELRHLQPTNEHPGS